MFLELIISVFTVANSFIALFIVVYAFLFLNKTKRHKDRRPWDYLFLASIIYLLYTLFLMMLEIYQVKILFGTLGVYELSIFFQFTYTGLILLAFISQTDLIFNNEVIIIMKKEPKKGDEKDEMASTPLVKVEVPGSNNEETTILVEKAPESSPIQQEIHSQPTPAPKISQRSEFKPKPTAKKKIKASRKKISKKPKAKKR
jgi:hypothetical protein